MKLKNKIFIVSFIVPLAIVFTGCTTRYVNINESLTSSGDESKKGTLVNRNENIEEEYEKLALYEANKDKNTVSESEEPEVNKEDVSKNESTSEDNKADDKDVADKKDKEDDKKTVDDKKEDDKKTDDKKADDNQDDKKKEEENKPEEEKKPVEEEIPEVFDAEFYASTYPDVVNVLGNSPEALYKHYKDYGKAEGRCANAEEYARINETQAE